jgi:hypothetical protein
MPSSDFPHLLKHMALAIHGKDYLQGTKERKLVAALEISIAKLVEWKYLQKRSLHGPPFYLTGKGRRREIYHALEEPSKSNRFDAMYSLIQEAFEGSTEESISESVGGEAGKVKAQTVKARAAVSSAYAGARPSMRKKKTRKAKVKRATVRRAKRR